MKPIAYGGFSFMLTAVLVLTHIFLWLMKKPTWLLGPDETRARGQKQVSRYVRQRQTQRRMKGEHKIALIICKNEIGRINNFEFLPAAHYYLGRRTHAWNKTQTTSFSRYYHMDNTSIEFMFRILLCWSLGGMVIVIICFDRLLCNMPECSPRWSGRSSTQIGR